MSPKNLTISKISPAQILIGENALSESVLKNFVSSSPMLWGHNFSGSDCLGFPSSVFLVEKKILQKFRREFSPIIKVAKPCVVFFSGECSLEEVKRLSKEIMSFFDSRPCHIKIIFAAGGGKILDTSKILAERLGFARLVTIPTSCATCAAFTPIAPTYYPDGKKRKTIELSRPPDMMIVDYRILLRQPLRLLVSGIADALAKYYETKAFMDSLKVSFKAAKKTEEKASVFTIAPDEGKFDLSIKIAEVISTEILRRAFEISHSALKALEAGENSEHFREIVYLTLVMPGLVSGIGGKKCRTAAAHALANGLTYLPAARGSFHGEKVGWGTLVQLALEGKFSELEELKSFFLSIKAPVKLESLLSVKPRDYRSIRKAFEVACAPEESMRFMAKKITPQMAYEAAMYVEKMR